MFIILGCFYSFHVNYYKKYLLVRPADGTAARLAPEHAGVVWSGEAPHALAGLKLRLQLPTEHLAAIAVGWLVLTDQVRALRWTLMLILAQTRVAFTRVGGA